MIYYILTIYRCFISFLQIKNKYKISGDYFVIGIIGRLVKEKGYIEFLDAAIRLCKKYKENTKMVGDNKASKVILIPLKEILIYDEEVAKDN